MLPVVAGALEILSESFLVEMTDFSSAVTLGFFLTGLLAEFSALASEDEVDATTTSFADVADEDAVVEGLSDLAKVATSSPGTDRFKDSFSFVEDVRDFEEVVVVVAEDDGGDFGAIGGFDDAESSFPVCDFLIADDLLATGDSEARVGYNKVS
jgi:hypothetical protein